MLGLVPKLLMPTIFRPRGTTDVACTDGEGGSPVTGLPRGFRLALGLLCPLCQKRIVDSFAEMAAGVQRIGWCANGTSSQPAPSHITSFPSVRIARLGPNGSIASFAPIASVSAFSSLAPSLASPSSLLRHLTGVPGGPLEMQLVRGRRNRWKRVKILHKQRLHLGPTPLMSLTCSRCRTLIGLFMTPLTTFWSALTHVSLLRRSTETMRILSKYNANSTLPGCLHSLVMGEGIWRSARASAMHRHTSPVSIKMLRCFP